MKNAISAAMVLIGAFIGAGFASGQEIWQYFGIFGNLGIIGIVISCLLLGAFTYCTSDNILCLGEKDYIKRMCGLKFVNFLLNCYMLIIFCTMITAFGESLNQFFGFPKIYGVIFMDFVAIIILYFGAEGMIKFNSVVTPFIIFGILYGVFEKNTAEVFAYNNFAVSSVLYTSYNVISIPFVLAGLKNILSSSKKIFDCSLIFSGVILLLAICILYLLDFSDTFDAIPLLGAVSESYACVFIAVLAVSMLTTAVSNGFGFLNGISVNKNFSLLLLGISGFVFSFLKFDFIVKYVYGFFGFMGLYILFINFYIFVKNREKPKKTKIK